MVKTRLATAIGADAACAAYRRIGIQSLDLVVELVLTGFCRRGIYDAAEQGQLSPKRKVQKGSLLCPKCEAPAEVASVLEGQGSCPVCSAVSTYWHVIGEKNLKLNSGSGVYYIRKFISGKGEADIAEAALRTVSLAVWRDRNVANA